MARAAARYIGIFSGLALLAGCAGGSARRPPVTASPQVSNLPVRQPVTRGELVLGRTAANLVALFGQPALDVREGNARKLQFAGQACVLDAYLYPPGGRGEPVVTHVDARLPDGRDTDRAACATGLRRR